VTYNKLESMERGGKVLAQILREVKARACPGMTTKNLDDIAKRLCLKYGVKPSFLGYQNYPAAICTSLNDEVVHGIPGSRQLKTGDIVSLDLGVYYQGFHTDAAITFSLGAISSKTRELLQVTEMALVVGVGAATAGNKIGDIGYAIQSYVEKSGFNVVRSLVGHSIGKNIHEDPLIPNFGRKDSGQLIKEGMALAIEPMVTIGLYDVFQDDDGWTYKTSDGSIAAHFEHTVYVTNEKPIILTK
jgi:methionyl aminopeptidase